jgi:hypothetical protein
MLEIWPVPASKTGRIRPSSNARNLTLPYFDADLITQGENLAK